MEHSGRMPALHGLPRGKRFECLADAAARATHADRSPYQCLSVHAGNPRLISFTQLEAWGLLPHAAGLPPANGAARQALLALAHKIFLTQGGAPEMQAFDAAHAFWLEDYALYVTLRQAHDHHAWCSGQSRCATVTRRRWPRRRCGMPMN